MLRKGEIVKEENGREMGSHEGRESMVMIDEKEKVMKEKRGRRGEIMKEENGKDRVVNKGRE